MSNYVYTGYWWKLARTYYMLVKQTRRTSHAILGRRAALKAIKERCLNESLPKLPSDLISYDRRKFLRY